MKAKDFLPRPINFDMTKLERKWEESMIKM